MKQLPLIMHNRKAPSAAEKRIVALAARAKLILLTEELRTIVRNRK